MGVRLRLRLRFVRLCACAYVNVVFCFRRNFAAESHAATQCNDHFTTPIIIPCLYDSTVPHFRRL